MGQSQSGMRTEETMEKMDGKALSLLIETDIKNNVVDYVSKGNRSPKLVVLLIGDNPASVTYVKNKEIELSAQPHEVSGMLLYAKTEEAITPDCSYVMSGNKISVKTLDLNKEFKLIAAQLDKIAEEYFQKM